MKRGFDGWLFNGKYNTEITLALIRYEEKRIRREKRRGHQHQEGRGSQGSPLNLAPSRLEGRLL